MICSHPASERSASGGRRLTAAEFTRMSGSPNGSVAASAARAVAARSARSALTQAVWQPAAPSSTAAPAGAPSPLASSTTLAPARARAPAIALPMPELPPVIRATEPSSENRDARNSERRTGTNHGAGAGGEPAAVHQRLQRRLLVQPWHQEPGA